MNNEILIQSIINDLITKGTAENFAILNLSDDYYIQLFSRDDKSIYCEAISNRFLPKNNQLSPAQIQGLKNLNWNDPSSENPNYFIVLSGDSEAEIAKSAAFLMKTATTVYRCNTLAKQHTELHLGNKD